MVLSENIILLLHPHLDVPYSLVVAVLESGSRIITFLIELN